MCQDKNPKTAQQKVYNPSKYAIKESKQNIFGGNWLWAF